jgi:hypothetical protein
VQNVAVACGPTGALSRLITCVASPQEHASVKVPQTAAVPGMRIVSNVSMAVELTDHAPARRHVTACCVERAPQLGAQHNVSLTYSRFGQQSQV